MKKLIRKLSEILFRVANGFIPKKPHQICLSSCPDYDDMQRVLCGEILKSAADDYQIILILEEDVEIPAWAEDKRITHVLKKSFLGMWLYSRSKFCFFTHGCFSTLPTVRNQISVNLWHGMPIKKVARYIREDFPPTYSNYILSTSPFFSEVLAYAFGVPLENVLPFGLPRNDILLQPKNLSLLNDLVEKDQKLVAWLPTYRVPSDTNNGHEVHNVFNLPDFDLEKINQALVQANAVAVVKPHRLARGQEELDLSSYSNIKVIDESWLTTRNTSLGDLLALSSVLITDISSVLVDYLLLNRPVICHFPDIEAYQKSRGFCWDFQPEKYNIPLVETQEALLSVLQESLADPAKYTPTSELMDLCHLPKGDFAKRLLSHFSILQ